ncbi:hypothetical protein R1sor_012452 [Riccia sorocarpa]|uniref:Reverse transcriptase zinc-binding domain-containing protein n=1 Tax=Riccia sorocarpa TaxID=122646 RepID=A0ABD3I4J9_9MARC
MRALREKEAQGNIQGVNIGDGNSLLHQLFADDTGICITAEEAQFVRLKEVIRDFEIASGASLNLQKSIVMQMRPDPSQTWMQESGCEVAGPGTKFVYLGVSTSSPVDEKVIADEIVQKLMRKLKRWSNRILEGDDVEWIHLERSFILRTLRRGSYQRECRQWSFKECLLLLPLTKIVGSPTLTRILDSWLRARRQLEWSGRNKELDGRMTMLQVKTMYQLAEANKIRLVRPGKELGLLRKVGIGTFKEAMDVSRRVGWKSHLRRCGIFPEEETLSRLEELEVWGRQQLLVRKAIMELEGWRWKTKPRQIMAKAVDFSETMEDKWRSQSQILQWQQRWKYVWEAPIPYKRRVWLRRIIQRGFFTNSKEPEMGHQDGSCKRCIGSLETLEHILWDCRKTRGRRSSLVNLTSTGRQCNNLLEWIDEALKRAKQSPAGLLVCIMYC